MDLCGVWMCLEEGEGCVYACVCVYGCVNGCAWTGGSKDSKQMESDYLCTSFSAVPSVSLFSQNSWQLFFSLPEAISLFQC